MSILSDLASTFSPLLVAFKKLRDLSVPLTKGISKLPAATVQLDKSVAPATDSVAALAKVVQTATASLARLTRTVNDVKGPQLVTPIKDKPGKGPSRPQEARSPTPAGQAPTGGFAAVGGALGASLAGVTIAAGAVVASFEKLVSFSTQFVQALNPSLVAMLNATFRDLQATIGVGLTPIVQAATSVLRSVADTLLPIMRTLTPIVDKISRAFEALLVGQLNVFASALTSLMPIVDLLADALKTGVGIVTPILEIFATYLAGLAPVFKLIADVLHVLFTPLRIMVDLLSQASIVIRAFIGGFMAVLNGLLPTINLNAIEDFRTQIRSAAQQIVRFVVVVSAAVARLFGFTNFLEGMIKSLEGPKRESSKGIAVAQNAQFAGVAELGRSIALSAFTSQGRARETQEDLLKGLREEVKGMRNLDLAKKITDSVYDAIVKFINDRGAEFLGNASSGVGRFAVRQLPGGGFIPESILGGLGL